MRKITLSLLLCGTVLGCQSSNDRSNPAQNLTPNPGALATVQPVSTPIPVQSPPSPTGVRVETDAAQVSVDSSGVKVEAGSAEVDVQAGGVKISAPGVNLDVQGASVVNEEGDKLVIQGAGDNKTYTVQDQDVVIQGASHNLKLKGSVKDLEVNGTNNRVEVEKVQEVEVNGTGNEVRYGGEKPEVRLSGLNNRCEPL